MTGSPALACILLALDLARSVDDLAGWWKSHQPALRILADDELAEAVAAKDRRKVEVAGLAQLDGHARKDSGGAV